MKFNKKIYVPALFLASLFAAQRPKPAPKQSVPIAITHAEIHTGNGAVLQNATLIFENGKITGINTAIPAGAKIIDAEGKKVYPGFILLNNTLGLVEIEATKATVDYEEANDFTPEARTFIGFNTDSQIIPTVRTNGILLAQPVMKGGILTGTSSVLNLDSWNWEDGLVSKDNGVNLFWPEIPTTKDEKRLAEQKERRKNNIDKLKNLFERAKGYSPQNGVKDFKTEALQPLFSGKKTLFTEAPGANEALEIIEFAKQIGIPKVVLIGQCALLPVLPQIKSSGFPLVIERVHSLPPTDSTPPRLPYEFPKIVKAAGILYALDYSGEMEYQNSRNLPFLAGTSVAYGVDEESALESITLNPAKMLGIDKDYGSLETGKSATLFISRGDALDPLTNDVTEAFIDGREINLDNQQKELYRRYKEKYAAQKP